MEAALANRSSVWTRRAPTLSVGSIVYSDEMVEPEDEAPSHADFVGRDRFHALMREDGAGDVSVPAPDLTLAPFGDRAVKVGSRVAGMDPDGRINRVWRITGEPRPYPGGFEAPAVLVERIGDRWYHTDMTGGLLLSRADLSGYGATLVYLAG